MIRATAPTRALGRPRCLSRPFTRTLARRNRIRNETMSYREATKRATPVLLVALTIVLVSTPRLNAQGRGQRGAQNAKTAAPIDLTGYWVSVVSEDWRLRMATPRKGDYESVTINAEGRRVADAWDIEKDNAAGLQCKAFGVGGIMRQP